MRLTGGLCSRDRGPLGQTRTEGFGSRCPPGEEPTEQGDFAHDARSYARKAEGGIRLTMRREAQTAGGRDFAHVDDQRAARIGSWPFLDRGSVVRGSSIRGPRALTLPALPGVGMRRGDFAHESANDSGVRAVMHQRKTSGSEDALQTEGLCSRSPRRRQRDCAHELRVEESALG